MNHTPSQEPKLDQSIARLKSVVTSLESRISTLVERSGQSGELLARIDRQQHELHVLREQVAALLGENAALQTRAVDAEKRYEKLELASRGAQSQLDAAINDLQLLLEREAVE